MHLWHYLMSDLLEDSLHGRLGQRCVGNIPYTGSWRRGLIVLKKSVLIGLRDRRERYDSDAKKEFQQSPM